MTEDVPMSRVMVVAGAVVLLSGCGGSNGEGSTVASPSAAVTESAASAPADPELVGEWQRTTKCTELVAALERKGLEASVPEAVAGNGFVPDVRDLGQVDPKSPCNGAVPRVHAHFFTADGRFGSRDWNGDDVDDGTYRADGEKLVISKEFPAVTFRYRITGDTLTLEPQVDFRGCSTFRCVWSVSVAYPGESWTRVE
jgi:hypothetical protein